MGCLQELSAFSGSSNGPKGIQDKTKAVVAEEESQMGQWDRVRPEVQTRSGSDCEVQRFTQSLNGKIPARYLLCFMLFLGFMVTFLLRVNINLAVVAMVNSTYLLQSQVVRTTALNQPLLNHSGDCPSPYQREIMSGISQGGGVVKAEEIGEFEWTEFQQGIILSSFFWGYLFFQIPGGRIAELWGTKTVFGTSVLMNGILALILPAAARLHWTLLLMVRALQGLGQGVVFPCLTAAVARWVPVAERARFISFAIQGCSLGQVVALPLCGWVLTKLGWPAVFYVSGILGLLWYFAWYFLVFDSPDEHPRISLKEKQFLQKHIEKIEPSNVAPVPWMSVFTSLQFWVGAIAAIGNDWGFHTFCNFGPKYMKNALGFDLEQSSWLSSLPFLSQYIFSFGYSAFCDWLLKVNVKVVTVRKFSVIVSHVLPAVGLIALSLTGCQVIISIAILTFCITLLGALSSGFFQNPLDIAPNYAGSLTGITNAMGALTAVVSTPLAGALLESDSTLTGWHYIFHITSAVYFITSLPYLIFAKVKMEPWNDPSHIKDFNHKEKKIYCLKEVGNDDSEMGESFILVPSEH